MVCKYEIKNVEISALKCHEQISRTHLAEIKSQIVKDGRINNPIIVDKDSFVILDGHHRYNAIKEMGLRLIPACLVDYHDDSISVGCWRQNENISKQDVMEAGLRGNLLKPKTSRHIIPNRPRGLKIPLGKLL